LPVSPPEDFRLVGVPEQSLVTQHHLRVETALHVGTDPQSPLIFYGGLGHQRQNIPSMLGLVTSIPVGAYFANHLAINQLRDRLWPLCSPLWVYELIHGLLLLSLTVLAQAAAANEVL
jgi:hypothetical protein